MQPDHLQPLTNAEQAAQIPGLILRLRADIERFLPGPGRFRPLLAFAVGSGWRAIRRGRVV